MKYVSDVTAWLAKIQAAAKMLDFETATRLENELYDEVLRAICRPTLRDGSAGPKALAFEALKSKEIPFERRR